MFELRLSDSKRDKRVVMRAGVMPKRAGESLFVRSGWPGMPCACCQRLYAGW